MTNLYHVVNDPWFLLAFCALGLVVFIHIIRAQADLISRKENDDLRRPAAAYDQTEKTRSDR